MNTNFKWPAVSKLGLKVIPVGKIPNKLGLQPVPLLFHSGETLVEVVELLVLSDTRMLELTEEAGNNFCGDGTYNGWPSQT